ncbi:unnamed protein product, partial [Pylaiella littoralis]
RACSTLPRSEIAAAREERAQSEAWAKQPGAREVLAQPPFVVAGEGEGASPPAADVLDSLDSYLKARQWRHPQGSARRFLSHLLTYPLTLASGLREAGLENGPDTAPTASVEEEEPELAVVCLGARAESTMPPSFWRETLFALPCVSHLSLHLIGPELSLPSGVTTGGGGVRSDGRGGASPRHTAVVKVGPRTVEVEWTRAVLGPAAEACVESEEEPGAAVGSANSAESGAGEKAATIAATTAIATVKGEAEKTVERAVDDADAFVLFNPGLGHPHLREGWAGALERLLATGKPIIVSCHSREDLERDARVLREAGAARCCPGREATTLEGGDGVLPRENAFRSLMTSEDPLSVPGAEKLVSCNWGILVAR